MQYKSVLLLTTLCAGFVAPGTANAAIFKCIGSDGEVSYNQTPCPVQDETAKVLNVGSTSKKEYNCSIANNFARKTAMDMREGQSSGEVFAAYGGIDAIPRTAIGVINYVYTHKGNVDTNPQRISALSAARCSAGSYGAVGCDDFPYGFISELGGCEAASKSTLTNKKPTTANAQSTKTNATMGATQAMGVRTMPDAGINSVDCAGNAQAQISALLEQMQSGQSASSQEQLQKKMENITAQHSGC